MISWDIIEHGKPLQKALHETPKPTGTEVLVRVTRSGVCHSDLHIWDGYFDWGGGKRFYVSERGCVPPFTLGHEPLGVVEAVGPRAEGVQVGQKRLVYPWIGCGKCAMCRADKDNYCVSGPRYLGITRAGAYATHVLIPHPKYLLDVSGLDDSFAATLACSALTAYSAINKLAEPDPKDWYAVIGCGGLGFLAVSMLRARGITNIVACDIDEAKLAAAKKLGALDTLDTRIANSAQMLSSLARSNLAAAVDFVGTPTTAGLGLAALRKGGHYVLCGLFGGELVQPMPPLVQRALIVQGSFVGDLRELKEVILLAKKGKFQPAPIETRQASEVNRTLLELKAGKILGRVVLDFETDAG